MGELRKINEQYSRSVRQSKLLTVGIPCCFLLIVLLVGIISYGGVYALHRFEDLQHQITELKLVSSYVTCRPDKIVKLIQTFELSSLFSCSTNF